MRGGGAIFVALLLLLADCRGGSDEFGVNVRRFGARGDGNTDDTVAIQEAVDFAERSGGREVLFPAGEYVLSKPITISNRVLLRGEHTGTANGGSTTLRMAPANTDILVVSSAANAISGFSCSNLNLVGNRLSHTGDGLVIRSTPGKAIYGVHIADMSVTQCGGSGVFLDASRGFVFDGELNQVRTTRNHGDGIRMVGAVGQFALTAVFSNDNGGDAIELHGSAANRVGGIGMYRVTASGAAVDRAGLALTYCDDISVYDVHCESNQSYEIVMAACRGVIIQGGTISQEGSSKGIVIASNAKRSNANIFINVPGWTNTSSHKLMDVQQAGVLRGLYLSASADGPITASNITGYDAAATMPGNIIQFRLH